MQHPSSELGFARLKSKQRQIRSGFPEQLGLRVHRAISWLGRAEREADDDDVRFILLWVGFNAAYASDVGVETGNERDVFKVYFDALVALDANRRIYNSVWTRFPHEIRVLLNNKLCVRPVLEPSERHRRLWRLGAESGRKPEGHRHGDGKAGYITHPLRGLRSPYVLRNQIVHGGATWNSAVNRQQVRDGAAILGALLPIFIDIMMDNPHRDWGKPFYPVVE